MATIVFLDFVNSEIVKVTLTEDQMHEVKEKYDNDFESWAIDNYKDEDWGIDFSNSQWMLIEGDVKERIV